VQFYNEGKVEEAIAEAKRLIEANPKHATAYSSLGYFLLEERRFDEAVDPMLRALELNPQSKETALHLRDVIDAYVEELIGIGAIDGFVSEQGGEKYDDSRRHRRTRDIGAILAQIGDSGVFGESGETYTSEKLMTKVFNEVQVRMSFRPESNALRPAWEGIGGWKP
jgi:tetratricopeptide (TPR) repeat protein